MICRWWRSGDWMDRTIMIVFAVTAPVIVWRMVAGRNSILDVVVAGVDVAVLLPWTVVSIRVLGERKRRVDELREKMAGGPGRDSSPRPDTRRR